MAIDIKTELKDNVKAAMAQDASSLEVTPFGRRRKRSLIQTTLCHLWDVVSTPISYCFRRVRGRVRLGE